MATHNVSNAAQLTSALAAAVAGDKIVLAAGNYGEVYIDNKKFASAVTIEAASKTDMPKIEKLWVTNCQNLIFSGLELGRPLAAGEPEWLQMNSVRDSSNIKMTGMKVHGSLDNDPSNDGTGLFLTGLTGFSLTDSDFTELFRAIAVQRSANVVIQGNKLHDLRSDGIVVASTDGIVIDSNRMWDLRPVLGDHGDFIQFWNTSQTKGQSNITIKNNVMMQYYESGVFGTGVQGIFISDGLQWGYKNVLIENNVIWSNEMYNGIGTSLIDGLQIIGNTIVSQSNDDMQLWIRLEENKNVNIKGNVTDNFILKDNVGIVQAGNINFGESPGSRALLPKLNDPNSELDLILAGAGYQVPVAPTQAPVSGGLAGGIGGILGGAGGSFVSKTAVVDEEIFSIGSALFGSPMLDLSGLQPEAQTVSFADADFHVSFAASVPWTAEARLMDHFVALP